MKTLVIIAGAAGEIGTEFCKAIISKNVDCVAVIRNKAVLLKSSHLKSIVCHLDNEESITNAFSCVDFETYEQIIYLHTIGVDKFDPRGYPMIQPMKTIDEEIYTTNVNSFKYLMRYCVQRIREMHTNKDICLKIAIVAGVADKHAPFVIESFCEAKYIVRQYMQSQVFLYPSWCSGLSINISSTVTASALTIRPYADTHFWLSPHDVVKKSIKKLLKNEKGYKEIDIIKKSPSFIEGYYEDTAALYEKWSKETGIN